MNVNTIYVCIVEFVVVVDVVKLDQRLTLFFLCNEVVQTCRRRHAVVFKDAFKEVLKEATRLVRYRPNCQLYVYAIVTSLADQLCS